MKNKFFSIFSEEEKVYLNSFMKNESLQTLSKEEMLDRLEFAYAVIIQTDEMLEELLCSIRDKVTEMKENEWKEFLAGFPIATVGIEHEL